VRAAGATVAEMLPRGPTPVRLFCGERDPMVNVDELRACDPEALAVAGCGHNPHVEAPRQVAALIRKFHLG
jgi:pimeloyl-ACP methyl ester carboxylesterase